MITMSQIKNIVIFLLLILSSYSCLKEDAVIPADQAVIDDEKIVNYLKGHKIVKLDTMPAFNIDWNLSISSESDSNLFDLAVIDSTIVSGVYHKYYYIEIEEGAASESGTTKDLMLIDYREFTLDNTMTVSSEESEDALEVEISSRSIGLKTALKYFYTGIVQEVLGLHYRNDTKGPGRGIIFLPSGLAYGEMGSTQVKPNTPIRIDLVLYHKKDRPTEN